MPSVSKSQQRLFAAAAHGASFPMAEQLRRSMPEAKLEEFTHGSMKAKPVHVAKPKARMAKMKMPHANLGKFLHPPRKVR